MNNSLQQVIKIWCVISDQGGSIISLGNIESEKRIKYWNIPCGTISRKDITLSGAVRRIVFEASGFENILHRMCSATIVLNKETTELHIWFVCIPADQNIPKKEVSNWIKVEKIPDGTIPQELVRSLQAII